MTERETLPSEIMGSPVHWETRTYDGVECAVGWFNSHGDCATIYEVKRGKNWPPPWVKAVEGWDLRWRDRQILFMTLSMLVEHAPQMINDDK